MADNGPILVTWAAASGGKAIAVQANAAKQSDIERLFAETEKAFGRLDILVNNAGICEGQPRHSRFTGIRLDHGRVTLRCGGMR